MSFKRVFIATLIGVLAGVACCLLSSSGGPLPLKVMASIFTGRMLIGFVIGISALKLNWALHGAFIGLVVSVPSAFGAMMSANAQFGKYEMFFMFLVAGIVYGFIIELVTSVFFKAKQA
jgi:hypothetical protein